MVRVFDNVVLPSSNGVTRVSEWVGGELTAFTPTPTVFIVHKAAGGVSEPLRDSCDDERGPHVNSVLLHDICVAGYCQRTKNGIDC